MFAAADVVFVGEVLSIEHGTGSIEIRWQVEDAVRGVPAGSSHYIVHEWSGLWTADDTRYRVGERAMVLLHAPSAAGYASPVSGADGIIPLQGDAATGSFDLRWIAQHVAVTDNARLRPMLALRAAGGDTARANAMLAAAADASTRPGTRAERHSLEQRTSSDTNSGNSTAIATASEDAHAHIDRSMVLGMLHAWQRDREAGR